MGVWKINLSSIMDYGEIAGCGAFGRNEDGALSLLHNLTKFGDESSVVTTRKIALLIQKYIEPQRFGKKQILAAKIRRDQSELT